MRLSYVSVYGFVVSCSSMSRGECPQPPKENGLGAAKKRETRLHSLLWISLPEWGGEGRMV